MTRILHTASINPESIITIRGEELHYLSRVRRHKVADRVTVVDRDGNAFVAAITHIDRQQATLRIEPDVPISHAPPIFDVSLFVALPKGNIMDDIVRKLNEIGAMNLYPFHAARTCHRVSDSKVARWQRIATESTRQCGRRIPLQVHPIRSFSDTIRCPEETDIKLILHPTAAHTIIERIPGGTPVSILVGPEGGFTTGEVDLAQSIGFVPVKLETPILRIETAAIASGVLAVALWNA